MSTGDVSSSRSRCLRVVPRPRGSWILATEQDEVLSEHPTASEAEIAAIANLREGEEVVVYDRYHRCHRRARPAPRSSSSPRRSPVGRPS
jgi:hypothetical protein